MGEQGADEVITVVLTADNHLGYSAFGQHARRREERLHRLRDAFQRTTDFAVGQGVDLFLQAGDLFDTPSPSEEDRSFVAARLAELRHAGIRTFAVSGIHDTPGGRGSPPGVEGVMAQMRVQGDAASSGLAPQVSYARLEALHYFPPVSLPRDSSAREKGGFPSGNALHMGPAQPVGNVVLEPVMLDVHGVLVAVCGLSVCAGQEGDPLAWVSVSSEVERASVSLLLLHAPIAGLGYWEGDAYEGALPEVARSTIASQSSFRAILAGYHHAYEHRRIGSTDVIVAGATQYVGFNDSDDDPGFVFLGLAADGVRWCHHIAGESLHVRRLVLEMAELARDVTENANAGASGVGVTDGILERLGPLCTTKSIVQLSLVGELSRDDYHQLDLGRIRSYGEEHCFDLTIDESGISLVSGSSSLGTSAPLLDGRDVPVSCSSEEVEERLSPREELVKLADEWIAEADDEQEKKALTATKEELLMALDRVRPERIEGMKARRM